MTEREELRKAIEAVQADVVEYRSGFRGASVSCRALDAVIAAAEKHLATLPKTRPQWQVCVDGVRSYHNDIPSAMGAAHTAVVNGSAVVTIDKRQVPE